MYEIVAVHVDVKSCAQGRGEADVERAERHESGCRDGEEGDSRRPVGEKGGQRQQLPDALPQEGLAGHREKYKEARPQDELHLGSWVE